MEKCYHDSICRTLLFIANITPLFWRERDDTRKGF